MTNLLKDLNNEPFDELRASSLLDGLNEEQKIAVTHDKGPILIIAGAGTGKTTVITRRIAWLIAEKKALPEEILALTFTDKAAAEMEERVDALVPYGFFDSWISTFHSFGDRILRENALELGLPADFRVLTFPEQMIFLKEHLFDLDLKILKPLTNPTRHMEALLKHFSRLKDEDISPNEYIGRLKMKNELASYGTGRKLKIKEDPKDLPKYLEVAKAYKKYEELMIKNGFLDFGDQIRMTLKLFREYPHILKKYQEKFHYILVDEYQDTNFVQNELVKLLAFKSKNITVVADDDQSIYRWRGAAISNVLDFSDNYKNVKTVVLNQNYRSTKEILDASYRLIQFNNPDRLEVKSKISKKLISKKKGPKVGHIFFDTLSSEADGVANIIAKKTKEGISYKDIAILIRKNTQAEPFMQALNMKNIPYKFSGSYGLYSRSEIRIILSFINAVCNTEDSLSLFHLMTSEVYSVDIQDAIRLSSSAYRENKTLEEKLKNPEVLVVENTLSKIKTINEDLKKFREDIRINSAGQVIYSFLKDTGYLSKLTREAKENADIDFKIQNIAKFFEKVMDFEYVSKDKGLMNFKNELDLLIEAGDDPATAEVDPDIDAVNIITVHKAKGLEYEIVFMINLVSGNFPVRRRSEQLEIPSELIKERLPEGDFHIQEERRLFYVAMTRAKKELYLTFAEDYGKKRLEKVSPFVLEALDLPKIESKKKKIEKIELIKKFEKTTITEVAKQFYNGGILNLNPHQIDDYISCPLKFKYIHILKIPVIKHHAVIYGSAIHNAIGEYFVRRINKMPVLLEDIIKVYENAWTSEGFIHRQHEKERFEQGKMALKHFFETQEKENRIPSLIEEKFGFVMGRGDLKIKVNGRYDAVYQGADARSQESGVDNSVILTTSRRSESKLKKDDSAQARFDSGSEQVKTTFPESFVEIRDFKTSDVDDQKKADDKAKKSRQLSIYALSYKEMNGNIPELLTLHYVDTGVVGKSERTEKDLEKTQGEIFKVAEGIIQNDFEAVPGYGECQRCAYRDICSFKESK